MTVPESRLSTRPGSMMSERSNVETSVKKFEQAEYTELPWPEEEEETTSSSLVSQLTPKKPSLKMRGNFFREADKPKKPVETSG